MCICMCIAFQRVFGKCLSRGGNFPEKGNFPKHRLIGATGIGLGLRECMNELEVAQGTLQVVLEPWLQHQA